MSSFPFPLPESQEPAQEPTRDRSFIIRWAVIGVALAVGVGLALGLWLGVFSGSGASSAAGIVSGDGFTVTRTLTPADTQRILAQDKSQDGQMAASMINGDAAAGIKGTQAEAAAHLSPAGKTMISGLLPLLASAEKDLRIRIVGDYLVISGPVTSLSSNPFANLGNG